MWNIDNEVSRITTQTVRQRNIELKRDEVETYNWKVFSALPSETAFPGVREFSSSLSLTLDIVVGTSL